MAETKAKKHDGLVRVWCAPCKAFVLVQGSVDGQNAVHVTPRHMELHRAEDTHLAALAAAARPRRRRGRRGGRGRGAG
ncbi:hypothetical protein [Cellulosimicrobium sp. I38E]|uniref:hypothetical protein n=1 Tax=Cellulosimicrobium sp. I38E TaxID=1393139 RepID=UPI000AAF38B1|nr:hypothetical protein [Cellulosimicrobium sp. I38E]